MKEIKPPALEDYGFKISSSGCPNCSTTMLYGPVPCPDGKPWCCVAHYGYTCPNCHKQFA